MTADRLITDDKLLRRVAISLGLATAGTATVVVALRRLDLVPSCRDVLERMLSEGFGIAENLIGDTLRQAGES